MKFRCPICGIEIKMPQREAELGFFPFCSEKCKLIDLGAWFDGTYRIVEPNSDRKKKDGED
jgi:endogenous inhibitor of DNA gyrase (YacG/DUF329 family)